MPAITNTVHEWFRNAEWDSKLMDYKQLYNYYDPQYDRYRYGYAYGYDRSKESKLDKLIREAKESENMAFAARNEDGKWFICIRRGRIIRGTAYPDGDEKNWIDFQFRNQKKAKACADELNDKFWDKFNSNGGALEGLDIAKEMIETIKQYL